MRKPRKQGGFIVTVELLFILAIMLTGLIIGWVAVRDSVVNELSDVAAAVDSLNQSYSFSGLSGHATGLVGSSWEDEEDFCDDLDNPVDEAGTFGRCILLFPALPEEF